MLFKKYTVYENKLSEKLSDDNPLKQKLISMETPTDHHPVYSFLSIGLLIYIWLFLTAMLYYRTYGYEAGIIVVLFVTVCWKFIYKKEYITSENNIYRKKTNIILLITILLSIFVELPDKSSFSVTDIKDSFLFFNQLNKKSYISLSILSFLTLGISFCYISSPYKIYRAFYSVHKTYYESENEKELISKYFILAIIAAVAFFPCIYQAYNPATDSFQKTLKLMSMLGITLIPIFIYATYNVKKYYNLFNKAKQHITKSLKEDGND